MSEEKSKQETPITEAVKQEVIPATAEEVSDADLEGVAGGTGRSRAAM
jgi:hypothetical protein